MVAVSLSSGTENESRLLTTFYLQRADLSIHGKIREIHGTAGSDRQPVHHALNTDDIDLKLSLSP